MPPARRTFPESFKCEAVEQVLAGIVACAGVGLVVYVIWSRQP